ncbi:MAG TPA: hypothetical protein RMH99_23080 [Sandaracinaceae bacterium LLY-WYZ-13_1]|nr:hypothetical protein [Sandaracinaceae bacterium LLY-WYZ-13_1]
MLRPRHTLAFHLFGLALALGGCWSDHGRSDPTDAGSPPPVDDAGTLDAGPGCAPRATDIRIVECPSSPVLAGDAVEVPVDHGVAGCCDAHSPRVDVSHDDETHTITAEWTVCSCCAECDCVGPRETERVSLGALEPGTHTIRAGASTCTVEVLEAATCEPTATEIRQAPTVLFDDQPMGATMRAVETPGCGCMPRVREVPDAVELALCNCCEECLCIDAGYEGGWTTEPHPVGEHTFFVGGNALDVRVVERDRCHPTEATGLEVVGPDPHLDQAGEELWWAVVRGTETLCCVPPAPAVEHEREGGAFDLSVHSCVELDCACVGEPVDYEAAHLLGELEPGTYTVRIDGFEETFTVPE